jgi:hypothetical protein
VSRDPFRGSAAELMRRLRFWPGGECAHPMPGMVVYRRDNVNRTWYETQPGVWEEAD